MKRIYDMSYIAKKKKNKIHCHARVFQFKFNHPNLSLGPIFRQVDVILILSILQLRKCQFSFLRLFNGAPWLPSIKRVELVERWLGLAYGCFILWSWSFRMYEFKVRWCACGRSHSWTEWLLRSLQVSLLCYGLPRIS